MSIVRRQLATYQSRYKLDRKSWTVLSSESGHAKGGWQDSQFLGSARHIILFKRRSIAYEYLGRTGYVRLQTVSTGDNWRDVLVKNFHRLPRTTAVTGRGVQAAASPPPTLILSNPHEPCLRSATLVGYSSSIAAERRNPVLCCPVLPPRTIVSVLRFAPRHNLQVLVQECLRLH